MAKSKNDVLKAGRKVADKAAAAGLAVTALAKVVERLEKLQKERDNLKALLEKNGEEAKVVWKALKAEVKGLEGELKHKSKAVKEAKVMPEVAKPTARKKAASKVSAPKPTAPPNPAPAPTTAAKATPKKPAKA